MDSSLIKTIVDSVVKLNESLGIKTVIKYTNNFIFNCNI